ncbi:MAG: hypothetical protein RR191_05700 [Cetobacterium sp.]
MREIKLSTIISTYNNNKKFIKKYSDNNLEIIKKFLGSDFGILVVDKKNKSIDNKSEFNKNLYNEILNYILNRKRMKI